MEARKFPGRGGINGSEGEIWGDSSMTIQGIWHSSMNERVIGSISFAREGVA